MDNIKFRAWHKEFEKYVDFLTGFDFENKEITWEERTVTYEHTETDKEYWTDFDQVIIEQYTGLKDKSGKEIYTGDIIEINHPFKDRNHIGEVIYEHYEYNIKDFWFSHFDYPSQAFSEGTEYMTVIGNIHEDKELL